MVRAIAKMAVRMDDPRKEGNVSRLIRLSSLCVVLWMAVACDRGEGGEATGGEGGQAGEGATETAAGPTFANAGNEMAFNRLTEELPALRSAVEEGGGENSISCAGNLSYADRLQTEADERILAVSNEVLEICGIQVPLMEIRAELAEARTNREADPAAIVAGNCSMARSKLQTVHERFRSDSRVAEVQAEIEAFCGN